MAAPVRLGRKRPLPACPNPLFVRWLTEWRDEAASKGRRTRFVFQKALRSLRRYPLPLRSGKEAKILQHFGDGLCRMLDERLQRHRAAGGDSDTGSPSGEESERRPAQVQDSSVPVSTQPQGRGAGGYWPARRSGARAILLLLYQEHLSPEGQGFLTKEGLLQRCAQKAAEVTPESGRPWPALRSLLQRNLLIRTHQPARYFLSSEGLELARKLAESEGLSSLRGGVGPEQPAGEQPAEPGAEPGAAPAELGAGEGGVQQLQLGPGGYRVLLCVDVGETRGAGHRPELLRELQRLRVAHSVRKLHVGDFVWVAQETRPKDPARPRELVLDHIVERKRLDDLCSSIIDGRFREQKFRLKRCGLRRRVYLVEDHGSIENLSLPESTLLQAITNTQVIDGFFVKRTADIKESAAYLALLTRGLQSLYQGHTLHSRPLGNPGDLHPETRTAPNPLCSLLTFSDFNAGAIKNKAQSVREVFARQLMQVSGVSGEKAAALVERYSTPSSLLAAYDACATPKEQELLLSTIKCGRLQRNLGPVLSRTLSQLYCSRSPLT